MFGFGERKIKITQLPTEAEKEEMKSPERNPINTENLDKADKNESEIKSYKQLDKLLVRLYDISALSVYEYEYQQDFIKPKRVYGIEISNLSIENYLSLKSPTIMRKATGLNDAPLYRARYISKYRADSKEYLVVMSSTRFEGFAVSELINIPVLVQNAISNITG